MHFLHEEAVLRHPEHMRTTELRFVGASSLARGSMRRYL